MATVSNVVGTLAVLRDVTAAWASMTSYPDVPHHWIRVLIELGMRGGEMPMEEMSRVTETSPSSITRIAVRLGPGDKTQTGLGWLEAYEDPDWRRRKLVRLTPKGRAAVEQLAGLTSKAIEKHYRSKG